MRTFPRLLTAPLYAVALVALSAPVALAAPAALSAPVATATPSAPSASHHGRNLAWDVTTVDADQSFRGLDAVDDRTAWVTGASVSGGAAKVYRTTNAGSSWVDVSPPGSTGLNFRDVEAVDARTATVLAIGEGEASRIYRTTDGGRSWTETFRNDEPTAFYNCMDFFPGGQRGLAVSDPVHGRFRIVATRDGGRSWQVLPDAGMPDSTGEANFSASGDCLTISGRDAWFGSGGAKSRVFHSRDGGYSWSATDSTIPAGEAAGVFALAFRTPGQGIAVGGDFAEPADGTDAVARSANGRTWRGAGDLAHLGEDVSWLGHRLVVVGQGGAIGGSSVSTDNGRTWRQFSPEAFHTLDCTRDGACWAAGGGGRVGRL
ncbi:WD40/YVTN/BNR-like repeat-containing protein [Knoellia sp. LjRoot47]|uniref:WD40/YVTN/BNR-like repeat-containing protein n=1 Tax=Knoellia sp. LjRoot47 TaxID=3342330 RepID=UPI003ECD710E